MNEVRDQNPAHLSLSLSHYTNTHTHKYTKKFYVKTSPLEFQIKITSLKDIKSNRNQKNQSRPTQFGSDEKTQGLLPISFQAPNFYSFGSLGHIIYHKLIECHLCFRRSVTCPLAPNVGVQSLGNWLMQTEVGLPGGKLEYGFLAKITFQ